MTPTKPLLRYPGGKWALAKWVIQHMPAHRIYVEPYGGAASVLLRKPRSFSEVYNDLDGDIVNLFRVLRDPRQFKALVYALRYTPFSREEFELAYQSADNPVEQARRTLMRSWGGHGAVGAHRKTGFRTNVRHVERSSVAMDWRRAVEQIPVIADRLMGVTIENVPAAAVISGHDTPQTLFYVDPPYPFDVRAVRMYRHEMDNDDHARLADVLHNVKGMVMISGYACDLYDLELYAGWYRVEREHYADNGGRRTEVLWLSPRTAAALEADAAGPEQLSLWEGETA